MLPLAAGDVADIERATAAAVSPTALEELDGCLLAFDGGTVNRAKSAVPLWHVAPVDAAGMVARIEAAYAARGLPPLFRLAMLPCFDEMRVVLAQRGYQGHQPTQVQVAPCEVVREVSVAVPADVDNAPDEAWSALFVGESADPADGASRVAALSSAAGSLYASVREQGQTFAAGAAAFSHGWASVHGMRTGAAQRGRGHAGRVLAGLAQAALDRGFTRCFLQVEAGNAAAQALYRRAGFAQAWSYMYWRRS